MSSVRWVRWVRWTEALRLLVNVVLSYNTGDRIAVLCRPGYVINQPSSSVQCTDQGVWSRPLPVCTKWQ